MAAPVVRSTKSTQKLTGTTVAPTAPTGMAIGDLVFLLIDSYGATGTAFSYTEPEGWTRVGEIVTNEDAETKRIFGLYYRKVTSTTLPTITFAGTSANSLNVYAFALEAGTFSSAIPVPANSGWVKGAVSTTQTAASVTATAGEQRALVFICSPTGTAGATFSAGWKQEKAAQTGPGAEAAWKEAALANAESSGAPTYTKGKTPAGYSLALVVAPTGNSVTLEQAQAQVSTLSRIVAYLRTIGTVAQAQVAKANSLRGKVIPLVSNSTTQSVRGETRRQGELIQNQVATMTYAVVPGALSTTGSQAVTQRKADVSANRSTAQTETPSVISAKPVLVPTAKATTAQAVGGMAERIKKVRQEQVAVRGGTKLAKVVVSTFNVALGRVNSLQARVLPLVTQNQLAKAGKTQFASLFTFATQIPFLSKFVKFGPADIDVVYDGPGLMIEITESEA